MADETVVQPINQSLVAYTGPYFNVTLDGLPVRINVLRDVCAAYYANGRGTWDGDVLNCIANNLNTRDQVVASAYQYVLTLWPAFISIIVAMGFDAAPVAYDNLPWSLVLALTCGAMPGLDRSYLPHQLETTSHSEARSLCETWIRDKRDCRKIARHARPYFLSGALQVASLLLSYGLWGFFVAYFIRTIDLAFRTSFAYPWQYGAIWYLVAAVPALLEAIRRLVCNNVDLYEPATDAQDTQGSSTQQPTKQAAFITGPTHSLHYDVHPQPRYRLRHHSNGLLTWFRIAHLQLWSRPYRLHVRPFPTSFFHGLYSYFVFMGRLSLFVWGSAVQGGLLFVPNSDATMLLVILILLTSMSRALGFEFWKRGRNGADLVVFEIHEY
ncbi:hypothetical protein MMC11_002052 [Xylographa trunciseda]|nr:hypothetical protein [Xylographa trunciseda]